MKKTLKIVAGSVLAVLLIGGAGIAYLAATFDPNHYKPQIVQKVKDKTGRALSLDGDIKLSFFPRLGMSLGKATLSAADGVQAFASFDDLRVGVAVLPLLSRQIVVNGIVITNLRMSVARLKNGKTTIDDLTAGDGAAQPASEPAGGTPMAIDIDHVDIKNATVAYSDEASARQYELSGLNLKTGRIKPGVPSAIDLSFHARSDVPRLDVDVALSGTLNFDMEKQTYALAGAVIKANGAAAGITGLDVSAQGTMNADFQHKTFALSALALSAGGKRDGGNFDLKISVPEMSVTDEKVSGSGIVLDAKSITAGASAAVKLALPSIAGDSHAFKAETVSAEFNAAHDATAIKGTLSGALSGSLDPMQLALPAFKVALNVDNPQFPKTPIDAVITGAAAADIEHQLVNLSFSTAFDGSAISGRAGLTRFTPPFYTFEVNVDKLDADRYLPKPAVAQKPVAHAPSYSPVSSAMAAEAAEQALDFSALKDLNASGSIKIGALKVRNIKLSGVHAAVKAGGGRLDVNPLNAGLYQGTLAGSASLISAGTPAVIVKQTLKGVDIGALLKDAAQFDKLEGRGDVNLDVTAQGTTVPALKKALNGSASLRLNDGAVKGINIAGVIRGIKSRLGELKGEQVQTGNAAQKTDFSELSASFAIHDGVAHNSDLAGKTPLLRLTGAGDIDIGNSSLDYVLKATVVATSKGQGGKELAELKGLTVPVRLVGPFDAPQYKIDFGGIAANYAQAALEGKKEEVKAKVEEKIKDKLKGLFGH